MGDRMVAVMDGRFRGGGPLRRPFPRMGVLHAGPLWVLFWVVTARLGPLFPEVGGPWWVLFLAAYYPTVRLLLRLTTGWYIASCETTSM